MPRSLRASITAVVLLPALAGGVAAAESPVPRFDWPDGLAMDVGFRIQGSRIDDEQPPLTWDVSSSSRWSVRRDGGRTFVDRTAPGEWKGKAGPPGNNLPFRIVEHIPRLVVAKDGSFLGVEGHDAARAGILESVPELRGGDALVRTLGETAIRDEGLRAIAEDFWGILIGAWLTAGERLGEGHDFSTRSAVPQLGGGELDIRVRVRLESVADCNRGGVTRSCGTFVMRSAADPEQVQGLLSRALTGAGAPKLRWTAFEQRNEMTVVAEVDTLVPHRATLLRESLVEVEYEGQKERRKETVSKEYTFAHVTKVSP